MLLSTASVARLTGATVRMIDHWARSGLLRPSGQDAAGKGSRRRYTFQDVIVLQAIQTLRKGNCPLQKVRTAIRYLKAHYPNEPASQALAKLTLLTDGTKVYLLTDERQLLDVVTSQLHITWAIPLGRIILDTGQRLEAMPQAWTEPATIRGQAFRLAISRERAKDPFVARCRELPGAVSEGSTSDEAIAKLREVIRFAQAREVKPATRHQGSNARAVS
ncbi:MAG: putative transcriptional regulator, MerR family [Phycisphaerales bacterium]|nr:putative transcriptional regulator, MerR family [Phycisphaerales bacterium]